MLAYFLFTVALVIILLMIAFIAAWGLDHDYGMLVIIIFGVSTFAWLICTVNICNSLFQDSFQQQQQEEQAQ